jgi:F0F1-type ATP synthase membrane subunit b/b'
MIAKAKEDIGELMNAQRATIDRDKAETLKQIKAEVAELVVMTVEKVLNEKMDSDKDQKIIKDLVN